LTFAEGKLKRAAKFTGKDLDEETGLYYFNARWYDSELGRFISEDPARDPNNPNLYTYARNNPLRFIDPTGLISLTDIGLSPATTGLSSKELSKIQIDKHEGSELNTVPAAYIFYTLGDAMNDSLKERAHADAKRWKELMGTDAYMFPVISEKQFVNLWASMDQDKEQIQYVALYFHSNPFNLIINADNQEYITAFDSGLTRGDVGSSAIPISSLESKSINALYLYACNSGHLDHVNNNLASAFLKNDGLDITSVFAWDGSMKWSKYGTYTTLAHNQDYFHSWKIDGNNRKPYGLIRYFKGDNGKIEYEPVKPIGRERRYLFWQFDLWETNY
jgi:RHS repeat-associated protein